MGTRVPPRIPAVERAARSISRISRSPPSPPAPRGACATTFWRSFSCASRTSTSASFHRPNLRYLVRECESDANAGRLLVARLRAHAGDNVIVYAPTIARVEETVDFLARAGHSRPFPITARWIRATRQRNQERWMSDEVPVLVGTIAFGLGINKAAVRAVIHLSLPKSIEQYYQEAGRAGRDGLPADCALLWQKRTSGCWRISSSRSAIRREGARLAALPRDAPFRGIGGRAAIGRSACISARRRSGSAARCAMSAAEVPAWFEEHRTQRSTFVLRAQEAGGGRQTAEQREPCGGHVVDPRAGGVSERVAAWRGQRDNVPAFIVLHDSTLDDLCRKLPQSHWSCCSFRESASEKPRPRCAILEALEAYRNGARAAGRAN